MMRRVTMSWLLFLVLMAQQLSAAAVAGPPSPLSARPRSGAPATNVTLAHPTPPTPPAFPRISTARPRPHRLSPVQLDQLRHAQRHHRASPLTEPYGPLPAHLVRLFAPWVAPVARRGRRLFPLPHRRLSSRRVDARHRAVRQARHRYGVHGVRAIVVSGMLPMLPPAPPVVAHSLAPHKVVSGASATGASTLRASALGTASVPPVSIGAVYGSFYANPGNNGNVSVAPGMAPLFTGTFPVVNFNPTSAAQQCAPSTSITENSRPFADVTPRGDGSCSVQAVQSTDGTAQAGVDLSGQGGPNLFAFQAVFTSTLTVQAPGQITFYVNSDDGWVFAMGADQAGDQPIVVSGPSYGAPASGDATGYPVVAAYNTTTVPQQQAVTLSFPSAGIYPIEIDYSECCGGQLELTLGSTYGSPVPPAPVATVGLSAGVAPADFSPQGGQTTVITALAVGPSYDPAFAAIPLHMSATVADSTGALVRTLASGDGRARDHWRWDGTSDAGSLVPPGVYTATVAATAGVGGAAQAVATSFPITVQDDAPIPPPCQLGLGGLGPEAAHNPSPQETRLGVNTASGNYLRAATDLAALPGPGVPLEWTRYYNSSCAAPAGGASGATGPFGPGWTFTYDERLVPSADGGTVTHVLENGQQYTYTHPVTSGATVTYATPFGTSDGLSYDTATAQYSMSYCSAGCGATYDAQGRLTALHSPHRGVVTTLSYNGNGLTSVAVQTTTVDGALGPAVQSLGVTSDPASGLISALSDPAGRTWRYGYTDGYLTSVTDPAGATTRYQYGATGAVAAHAAPALRPTLVRAARERPSAALTALSLLDAGSTAPQSGMAQALTGVRNASGGVTTIGYDAAGRATSVEDPLGATTTISYDTALTGTSGTGAITATVVTDALGGTRSDYYDDHGRLRRTVDPTGGVAARNVDRAYHAVGTTVDAPQGRVTTDSSYDANGDQTSAADGLGNVTTSQYDARGNLTARTDSRGFTSGASYDAAGDPVTSTDALGNSSTAAYDDAGNLTSSTDANGHTTTYSYDALGNQTGSADAQGTTTATSYDALGHPLTATDALGRQTTNAYDEAGRVVSTTDALGQSTRYGYDALGRTVAVTDALGEVTRTGYDEAGRVVSTTDALGNVTTNGYDALGRTVAVTDALGGVTRTGYDAAGRVVTQTDALGTVVTHNVYDAAGQLVERDDAAGHATTYGYDAAGRLVTQTDALGNTTAYGYDELGRTVAVTDAAGNVTQSVYDGAGRLQAREDALGHQTAYGYDALGQTVAVTDAAGGVTRSQYDPTGRLLTSTDALGRATAYGYDALGHTVAVTDAAGNVTHSAYDDAGRLLTSTDALGGQTAYGYDALGRTVAVTDAAGRVTRSLYDADGRPISSADALGDATTYGYDALAAPWSSPTRSATRRRAATTPLAGCWPRATRWATPPPTATTPWGAPLPSRTPRAPSPRAATTRSATCSRTPTRSVRPRSTRTTRWDARSP